MLLILLIKKQYVSSDSRLGLARNTKHYFYNNLSEWATPEEEREKVRAVLSELRLRLFNLKEVINGRYEYYIILFPELFKKEAEERERAYLEKWRMLCPTDCSVVSDVTRARGYVSF
jgi:hypothetical protein